MQCYVQSMLQIKQEGLRAFPLLEYLANQS